MYPEVFHLSFLHTYGVLVAIAFLVGLWLAGRLAKRAGLDPEAVTNLGIYCALAAIAGANTSAVSSAGSLVLRMYQTAIASAAISPP